MRPSHLVFAAFFAIAAFEVDASLTGRDLPVTAIQSCLSDLRRISDAEGHSESHNFNLEKRCPELVKTLAQSLREEDVGVIEIDAVSIEGLHDLASFAAGFNRRPETAGNFNLDFNGLDALLGDVLIENEVDDSVWDRFLRWLEQYVKDDESSEFKRFLDWLDGLDAPPWLGDIIVNTSVVLIVLLALIVVGNELRLSGMLRRPRRKHGAPDRVVSPESSRKPRPKSLDQLRQLPPRELAAAILEIVTAAFAERGWLSSSSSLTNGELVRQIGQRQDSVARSFSSLISGIERIIYGDRSADDETRQRLIDSAGALIEQARRTTVTPSGRPL